MLLRYVSKKFCCQIHEDGAIAAPKYVKDSRHKLQNSAFVGVTSDFNFAIMHEIM